MGVGAGLYMCDVVKKFTFAISPPDEFLFPWLTEERPYALQWAAPFPQNCPFPWGIWTPSGVIHGSLRQPEPIIQEASRSVQPFCRAYDCGRHTDRPTDRPTDHVVGL